jgi:hypothetical protein
MGRPHGISTVPIGGYGTVAQPGADRRIEIAAGIDHHKIASTVMATPPLSDREKQN